MSGAATGTSIPIAALANAHSGTSPTQAELVNLTRNVQVFGASSSFQTYVYVAATASVDWDYGEFYWMGSVTSNKLGIDVTITTGSFTANHISVHDGIQTGSRGPYMSALTSGTFSLSNSVFYGLDAYAYVNETTTNTTWTVTGNIALTNNSTSREHYLLNDAGGTFTNNTSAGCACSSSGGVRITDTGTWGTISGNTIHGSNGNGFHISAVPAADVTITNTTVWRNSAVGWNMQNVSLYTNPTVTVDGVVAFGNTTYNVAFNTNPVGGVILNNLTLNGDTTFSTSYGIFFNGQSTTAQIYNSSLGVASGIKTTHSLGDWYFPSGGSAIVYGSNVTMASATAIALLGSQTYVQLGIDGYGQVAGDNRSWSVINGTLFTLTRTDTAVYKTASPSQRITPATASYKAKSSTKTVAVASGATTTISVWVRKSISTDSGGANYNGNQPRLIVQRNPICGIGTGTADVVLATMTAAVGTWEQLSGTTGAVSTNCTLTAYVDLDGTAGWINVDDWAATNAQSIGDEKYWTYGTTDLTLGGSGGGGGGSQLGVPVLNWSRWPSRRWVTLGYPLIY